MTEEKPAVAEEGENEASNQPLKPTALLDAVNDAARRFGVREGQSIAEARALVSQLSVREVTRSAVLEALGRIAELALGFGPTTAIQAPDTVWVDVTGAAHLAGGEAALALELGSRVRELGHVARVAVAGGPSIAQAFARWSSPAGAGERGIVVTAQQAQEKLAALPILALPLERECAAWLMRLGVLTIGDLAALPRAASAARLGPSASHVLDLCQGRDPEPLVAYQPPRVLVEAIDWDEGVEGVEPLLFALRGLVSRLSGRLVGRGEAARVVELCLLHDRSVARLNDVEPSRTLHFEFTVPLSREDELRRVIASRLERTTLRAPCIGLRLEVPSISAAPGRQLDLSRVMGGVAASCRGAEGLPVVLAELAADIGPERFGVLRLVDAHRPEAKHKLVAALRATRSKKAGQGSRKLQKAGAGLRKAGLADARFPNAPTRLLERPLRLQAALRAGATLPIGRRLYKIERVLFDHRLEAVEWWSRSPVTRDYLRLLLESGEGVLEALVYVDRESGQRFLQAIAD